MPILEQIHEKLLFPVTRHMARLPGSLNVAYSRL